MRRRNVARKYPPALSAGCAPKSAAKTWKCCGGRAAAAAPGPPAAATVKGTAMQLASTMMIPFGRSVCATATIPPIAVKRITKSAAIAWPVYTEMPPFVSTFRM